MRRFNDWKAKGHNEEFVCSIFGALGHRYWSSASEHSVITVFDRGVAMFEAVAVAVIAIKSPDRDLTKARATLHTILEENHLQVPKERLTILFKHGDSLEQSLRITMSRESGPEDERYRTYQLLLQSELQRQERSDVYQHVIGIEAASSIGEVQNKLREAIFHETKNPLFVPLMHRVDCVYAFSGLSESGKSRIAEEFCSHYGAARAFRAKIIYFNDLISEKLGRSIYSLPEREQALLLLHELERFSNDHYWLQFITIESLHSSSIARWLKIWIGKRLQVVFIDTVEVKRRERALVTPEALIRNDTLKRERGVETIQSDADLVLDNNGPLAHTVSELLLFAEEEK